MAIDSIQRTVRHTAAVVVVADQLTKLAGTANLDGAFLPVRNSAYSLGVVGAPTVVLVVVSAVVLIAAARCGIGLARAGRVPGWVPGLLIGGAASNLADRVMFGAVRDFIPTPLVIFNLADVAVLGGVVAFAVFEPTSACGRRCRTRTHRVGLERSDRRVMARARQSSRATDGDGIVV